MKKLFKDKRVTTVRGFMTLHMFEGNKLYVELPDSLLGREMLLGTTIEEKLRPRRGASPDSSPAIRSTWSSPAAIRSSACGACIPTCWSRATA